MDEQEQDYSKPFPDVREQLARELFAARGFRASAWDSSDRAGTDGLRRDCRYLIDRLWTVWQRQA